MTVFKLATHLPALCLCLNLMTKIWEVELNILRGSSYSLLPISQGRFLRLYQISFEICCTELCTCMCIHVVCVTAYAQLSWVTECYRGGSMRTHTTPLTPGCHCAPVMINHVLQRLTLFRREGTNHTPHYPGLVTPKRGSPRTPQPVAVWRERGSEQERERERENEI